MITQSQIRLNGNPSHSVPIAAILATPTKSASALPLPATGVLAALKRPIKIFLVDDHPVVRRGICACLSRHSHLQILGEAADGMSALNQIRTARPDVVIADLDMPELNGLGLTEALRRDLPETKVIIISMHRQSDYVVRMIQSGARGYVLKDAPTDELVTAIETVSAGETFFSSEVARLALTQFVRGAGEGPNTSDLTNREREVLTLIAEGLSNKEIATRLGVGVRTVETHRERVMRKLNIHSVAGLTRFAISKGLVSLRLELKN